MYDVIVIGARVAGASTAMLLAGNGYRVLLLVRGLHAETEEEQQEVMAA